MPTTSHTVLLHVNEHAEGVARAILTSRTLHKVRPEVSIRILINGHALTGVATSAEPLDIDHLPETAALEACEIGMRVHETSSDSLKDGAATTPSVLADLSNEQFAGAAYIRL